MISEQALFRRFVGRRSELDALLAAFRHVKSHEQGAAILVTGEAGVGKTRLVEEFARRVERERCTVLRGACLEYLSTPYQPFVEALATSRGGATLEAELRSAERDRTFASEAERHRRFQIVADHLRRQSATGGPLVLILEDLHWSDAASIELWRFLTRRLRDAAVLLVSTLREEDVRTDPAQARRLAAVRSEAAHLRVGPLADADIVDSIRAARPAEADLSPHDVHAIVTLAEGKPLFAEELLRGALERSRQSNVEPVISVRATVLERLVPFSEEQRRVIVTGAVIGRAFGVDLLASITGLPRDAILVALRRARNAQLILEDAQGESFRFRHAITREIVYAELLVTEARALHRKIAATLAAGDAASDDAAYHWWAAGIPEQAVSANDAAGDRAGSMCAYDDASEYYLRALDCATGDARDALVEKLTFSLCAIGDMERARAVCELAASDLREGGRESDAQRLLLWAARQLYEGGEIDRALETARSVREGLAAYDPTSVHYSAAMTLAGMLSTLGRADEVLAVLDEAARLGVTPEPIDRFRYHNARGHALCSRGSYAQARADYAASLAIATELDSTELQLHALLNEANAQSMVGAIGAAAARQAEALALADRSGLRRHTVIARAALGHSFTHLGELQRALDIFRAIAADRGIAPLTQAFASAIGLRLRGLLHGEDDLDRLDDEALVRTALDLRESQIVASVTGAAALAALERGDAARAASFAQRGIESVSEPDHAYWLCDAIAEVGDAAALAKARALLESAALGGDNPRGEAMLALFDARCLRRTDPQRATSQASRAAAALQALGLQLEAKIASDVAEPPETIGRNAAASPRAHAGALTPREAQVAGLAARGYATPQIATELGIGRRTVESHLAVVYRKLGVASRAELIAVLHASR